jgi:hypothetical protein
VAGMPAICAKMAGLSATRGSAAVQGTDGDGWTCRTNRSSTGTVPLITVRDILNSVENAAPFIVKIDIEGFEADLFSDNCEWVDEVCTVFIEPHDWLFPKERTSAGFQRAFGQRDFSLFINGGNLIYVNNKFSA